jgi:hypothetical protein
MFSGSMEKSEGVLKFLETNENKNTTYQNLRDSSKRGFYT